VLTLTLPSGTEVALYTAASSCVMPANHFSEFRTIMEWHCVYY
jgi:hypothetical protein